MAGGPHKIKFDIAPDGKVKYEVIGSQDCVGDTEWVERVLGGKVEKREFKPEYYEEATAGVKVEN